MSLPIDSGDRILNKTVPTSLIDKTMLNAIHVMNIFDKIVNGEYRGKVHGGTTAQRPVSPEIREFYFNTDYIGFEIYTSLGWLIIHGVWSMSTRPSTSGLAVSSGGYNTTISQKEFWDGSSWRLD